MVQNMETDSAPIADVQAEGKTEMTSKDYYFDRLDYFSYTFELRTNSSGTYIEQK